MAVAEKMEKVDNSSCSTDNSTLQKIWRRKATIDFVFRRNVSADAGIEPRTVAVNLRIYSQSC